MEQHFLVTAVRAQGFGHFVLFDEDNKGLNQDPVIH